MQTYDQLREKASEMELAAVNFLTKNGEFAEDRHLVAKTEFIFIDGTKMVLPKTETERPEFGQLQFRLRPAQSN